MSTDWGDCGLGSGAGAVVPSLRCTVGGGAGSSFVEGCPSFSRPSDPVPPSSAAGSSVPPPVHPLGARLSSGAVPSGSSVSRALFESGKELPTQSAGEFDWACAPSERERDLRLKHVMREVELDVLARQRSLDDSGSARAELAEIVAEFLIPREAHSEKSVCDVFIERIRGDLLNDCRAPGSWRSYSWVRGSVPASSCGRA